MSITDALRMAAPDDAEAGRIAAWALHRLAESMGEPSFPADAAKVLAQTLEPLLELEEAYQTAAENFGSLDLPSSQRVAADFSHAATTTARLRSDMEQLAARLNRYGYLFPESRPGAQPGLTEPVPTEPQRPSAAVDNSDRSSAARACSPAGRATTAAGPAPAGSLAVQTAIAQARIARSLR